MKDEPEIGCGWGPLPLALALNWVVAIFLLVKALS